MIKGHCTIQLRVLPNLRSAFSASSYLFERTTYHLKFEAGGACSFSRSAVCARPVFQPGPIRWYSVKHPRRKQWVQSEPLQGPGAMLLKVRGISHFTVPKRDQKAPLVSFVLHTRPQKKLQEEGTDNFNPFSSSFLGSSFTKKFQPFLLNLCPMMNTQAFIRDDHPGHYDIAMYDFCSSRIYVHLIFCHEGHIPNSTKLN